MTTPSLQKPWVDSSLAPNGRRVQENFERWFGGSCVHDDEGVPMPVFHGTADDFEAFDESVVRGGFHFGTLDQASMRVSGEGKMLMPVFLRLTNPRRCKDMGGWWGSRIDAARYRGHDGIVYLNRYEGIPLERVKALRDLGYTAERLEALPDSKFRRLVPEARDSYIVFEPTQIKSALGNDGTYDLRSSSIVGERREVHSRCGAAPEPTTMPRKKARP